MRLLSKILDIATFRSENPVPRLVAYYVVLIALITVLGYFVPAMDLLFSGERLEELSNAPRLLEDGLGGQSFTPPSLQISQRLTSVIIAAGVTLGSVFLMLPVTWVYMSASRTAGFSQAIVQTLLMLPVVVAGIVLIVRNSLALAFSLAGIVAGVQFRNRLRDPREAVYIFLAIAVGLAAGVQALTVALALSMIFNFVVLAVWRSDFGHGVLTPSAATPWQEPLATLAETNGAAKVPDRDLVLALSPANAGVLADRFARIQQLVGTDGRGAKPRYNAVLWVTTSAVSEAQRRVEAVLNDYVKRWQLDEAINNVGKRSELYYLVRVRKGGSPEELVTLVRAAASEHVVDVEVQMARAPEEAGAS